MNNIQELCEKWKINKTINPITNRKIKENGPKYKELEKLCEKKIDKDKICNEWNKNRNINPETGKSIKNTGTIYKKLLKLCEEKKLEINFL